MWKIAFKKNWSDMACLGRPYHFKIFKGYLPQILLDPFVTISSTSTPLVQVQTLLKTGSKCALNYNVFETYFLRHCRKAKTFWTKFSYTISTLWRFWNELVKKLHLFSVDLQLFYFFRPTPCSRHMRLLRR